MGDWGIFNDIKDAGLNRLLTPFINSKISSYGTLSDFRIDSKKKEIHLNILLKGESETITVSVYQYEIVKSGTEYFVTFQELRAEREWINLLIQNELLPRFIPGNHYPISAELAAFIKRFV